MIDHIIEEINNCLSHELLIAGLTLSLTLIDACARVEYPNQPVNNKRYKQWYQEFVVDKIFDVDLGVDERFKPLYPNSDEIYSLRNNMLHESNPKIDSPTFKLFFSNGYLNFSRNSSGIIIDGVTTYTHNDSINVKYIIKLIVKYAEEYYCLNPQKFENLDFVILSEDDLLL